MAQNDRVIYSPGSFIQKLKINWLNFSQTLRHSKAFVTLYHSLVSQHHVVPGTIFCTYISCFEKFQRQMDIFIRKMLRSKFAFLGLDGTAELVSGWKNSCSYFTIFLVYLYLKHHRFSKRLKNHRLSRRMKSFGFLDRLKREDKVWSWFDSRS